MENSTRRTFHEEKGLSRDTTAKFKPASKNRHAILRNKPFISLFPNIDKIAFHQRGRNDLQAPKQKPGSDSTTLKFVISLACSVVQ